jgi:hypothetical protein
MYQKRRISLVRIIMIDTPQMSAKNYQDALEAFSSGAVTSAKLKTLQDYLIAIAHNATGDDAVQSRDMVQAMTLNHLILQHHISGIERRNSRMQCLVIALAFASLAGTGVQSLLAYKADGKSKMEQKAQPTQKEAQKISKPKASDVKPSK